MNADAGLADLPETDGLPPTSLRLEGARPATPSRLATMLVSELRPLCTRFDAGGFLALRDDLDAVDALRDVELDLELAGGETVHGVARGYGEDGSLVLETSEGVREHRSGLVARVHGGTLRESPA